MKQLGYGLGSVLLFLAAATLVAQLLSLLVERAYRPIGLGSIWAQVHPGSLAGLQAMVEGRVSPSVWLPLHWLLALPAFLTLGLLGMLLYLSCKPRGRGFD